MVKKNQTNIVDKDLLDEVLMNEIDVTTINRLELKLIVNSFKQDLIDNSSDVSFIESKLQMSNNDYIQLKILKDNELNIIKKLDFYEKERIKRLTSSRK